MTTTTATAAQLFSIARHWPDLQDALGAPALLDGFGRGLRGYLAAVDADLDELAQYRADERADTDPAAPGARPLPLRVTVLDTMRTVEAALHDCADALASAVQRPPMSPAPRTWPAADRARRDQLAAADAADRRRWRWTGTRPGAQHTTLWLLARIEGAGGPFRPLNAVQRDHIATVARSCAERVEITLDIAAQRRTLESRHDCGGLIDIHGGAGAPPVARCTECGHTWTQAREDVA